jgi:hypothetical protein
MDFKNKDPIVYDKVKHTIFVKPKHASLFC